MSDIDRIRDAKKRADETAYREGYRRGIDESMWGVFILGVIGYFTVYWFG